MCKEGQSSGSDLGIFESFLKLCDEADVDPEDALEQFAVAL